MVFTLEDLYPIPASYIPASAEILRDAFQKDPLWNALFVEYSTDIPRMNAFYETPLRFCFKYGQVYANSNNLEGVAAWVPGEYSVMTFRRLLSSGAFLPALKMGYKMSQLMNPVFSLLDKDRSDNMQGIDYLYLMIIGVRTVFQGKGFGGKLIEALISYAIQMGKPIYLETQTEANVRMYEKFGFSTIRQVNIPEIDLPMWEMVKSDTR